MVILLGGLGVLAVMAGIVVYLVRNNGDSVSATVKNVTPAAGAKSTGGTEGGPDTVVDGPASRFSPSISELPGRYGVDVPDTFAQNISTFASSYLFKSSTEGSDYARQWKILDGYNVIYQPDGLNAGVLQGHYYVSAETYLFQDVAGAKAAFDYMDQLFTKNQGSVKQPAKGLGLQSGGYQVIQGTVGTSDMALVYHRFLFRRGNVVATVMTTGGGPFMTIDQARDIAVIIDDRILGKRAATTPTPIPTPSFGNIPPTAAPSATR
jgi:hypothetical protein